MQLHVNRRFRQLQSFVLQGDLINKTHTNFIKFYSTKFQQISIFFYGLKV